MAWTPYLTAVLLGVIEGITEFLPISSTGHLIFFSQLLGEHNDKGKVFEIFIQLGAILAVCWEYRRMLCETALSLLSERKSQRFASNLALAFLPSAVGGLLLYSLIKEHLFSVQVVGAALVIGGIAIIAIERMNLKFQVNAVEHIGPWQALKIGCAQMLAFIPGVSRSGATILGGMLFGLDRKSATEFSFHLAIPTMFAATGYDLARNWSILDASDFVRMMVGFATAFFAALLTIRFLIRYVSSHDFTVFGWYRIVFGLTVLAIAFS